MERQKESGHRALSAGFFFQSHCPVSGRLHVTITSFFFSKMESGSLHGRVDMLQVAGSRTGEEQMTDITCAHVNDGDAL